MKKVRVKKTMSEKKLLVIVPGKEQTSCSTFHLIAAKTGMGLGLHFCSHWSFAMRDLYENKPPEYKKELEELLGGEIEVKFIDDVDITLEEILERNKIFYEEN